MAAFRSFEKFEREQFMGKHCYECLYSSLRLFKDKPDLKRCCLRDPD